MSAKRIFAILYFCNAILLATLLAYPVRSGLIRLLILGSAAVALVGLFVWIRRWWVKCVLLGALGLVIGAIALLPARSIDTAQLRKKYVEALRRYEGTRYIWGGENGRGVDCSGIVRAAWIDSQFHLGVQTCNPQLLRNAFSTWWNDSSARHLSFGADGQTRELSSGKSVRSNKDSGLLPGDFAIVANGVHALAFLGDQRWIEADPAVRKVIVLPMSDNNPWLDSSAVFVRWRMLE